jgi:hypothetical protein
MQMVKGVPRVGLGCLQLVVLLMAGCSSPSVPEAAKVPVAPHRIVSKKDLTFGGSHRFQIRVSLPETYDRPTVELIAHAIAEDASRKEPINALSMLFYGPNTETIGAADVALVDWAPNGNWGDGDTVKAGDYRSFKYKVTYLRE